jgi:osmoprotectant transport system permease protein
MSEQLTELVQQLPAFLGGHLLLSVAALVVGLAISLPAGIAVSRRPRLAELTLGVAGVVQTVPSLALLALMVLVLGGLIGFVPAFLALTLYSILPMLANTITGIRGVDPLLIEAARGLGMDERQLLLRVQLPLAAPVIVSGIRTATVLVVGTATLVSPVGGRSLGNYIFQGLESMNHLSTVFGCVIAAVLAIALDQFIRLVESAARRRNVRRAAVGVAGLLLVVTCGLYPAAARAWNAGAKWSVVGSGPFTEQHILSEVMARRLESGGFRVDQRRSMSEGIQFLALSHNQIDCMVNYSGNVWALLMKRSDPADRRTVLDEVNRYLRAEHGIVCLGSLGFENAYALAMRRDEAERLGIRTVNDLSRHAPQLRIASDNQFFSRPEWFRVRDAYRLQFREQVPMDPTLMYGAVAGGQVDVITAYTSDGRIKAYHLVLLDDSKQIFPPYDAVLLVSGRAARRPGFVAALKPLVGRIPLEAMQDANYQVDVEHWPARRAGEELSRRFERSP